MKSSVQESKEKKEDRLFSREGSSGMTEQGEMSSSTKGRFRLDILKKSFTVRVVKHWYMLPREMVDTPSLDTVSVRLDQALGNLI